MIERLDKRFGIAEAVDAELYRRVPNYTLAFHRQLGALALILIVVEFLTGALLGLYYVPDGAGNPAPAFTSVQFIQDQVYLGWLVRGVHILGASLLLVVALLHMLAVLWTGGYRAPRELNWTVGVVIFLLIVAFALTGSLLPWTVNAYLARQTEISIASGVGVFPSQITSAIKILLQGGPSLGPQTLLRFYLAHLFLLPMLAGALVYAHIRLVRGQGPSPPL